MLFNYMMLRNVFGKSSRSWHPMDNSALDVRPAFPSELTYFYLTLAARCLTLIHCNEGNLTVRRRGSSNHDIFVMLWVNSNHLVPELQVSTLTTHPLNSLYYLFLNTWRLCKSKFDNICLFTFKTRTSFLKSAVRHTTWIISNKLHMSIES